MQTVGGGRGGGRGIRGVDSSNSNPGVPRVCGRCGSYGVDAAEIYAAEAALYLHYVLPIFPPPSTLDILLFCYTVNIPTV